MIRYLNPFKPQSLVADNNIAYVVPGLSVAQIRALTFHNATESPISIEVYLVPASGSVQASNRLVKKHWAQMKAIFVLKSSIMCSLKVCK